MLLALDTSTPLVGVALHDGASVVHRAVSDVPLQHGEQLAVMIAAALDDTGADRRDLTGIAVGVGPGPFTGLRVGVVTARVLSLALGVPAHGVSSLDVLAATALAGTDGPSSGFVATLDARRKELFWAEYDAAGRRVGDPQVGRPETVPAGLVVGAGPVLYAEAFPTTLGDANPAAPDPGVLAQVVQDQRVEVVEAEPVYLRRPDAVVPGPPKAVS